MAPSMVIPPQNKVDAATPSKSKKQFVIISLAFLVFASAALMVLSKLLTILRSDDSLPCLSETCIYQEFLINSLNKSANPCDDFGSYVCSAMTADDTLQWNLKYNPKYIWAWLKSNYLARSNFKDAPWMMNAASGYESCIDRTGENEKENIADLVLFMKKLRLAWPHNLDDKSHPLDVALELAIRWEMPFWFKVTLLQKTPSKPRSIYLSHGTYTPLWIQQYKELSKPKTYAKYRENYLNLFSVNSSLNMMQVQKELEITTDVLKSLHVGAFRKLKNATVVPIHDLERFLPAGEGASWTDLLNKHFNQTPPFASNETVLLSDTEILEVIRRLVAKYGPDIMMYQLGWWFVQYYAVIASDRAFLFKYGESVSASVLKPLFCEIQVEALYKWAMMADHVKVRFAENDTNTINTLLKNIIGAAVTKLHESSWIDESSLKTAVEKLSSLSINLWPDVLPSTMMNVSAHPPRTSFVKNWIYGYELKASLLGTKYYYETNRLAHNMRDPSFRYNYLLNELSLAMLTTEKPFYIHTDSFTLNYAGLGSAFARVLVKAFDPEGVMHLRDGSPMPWLSTNTSVEFMNRASCKNAGFEDRVFPEIPGLEVSFQAFQEERRVSSGDSVNPRGFGDNQMFFIQFCNIMCRMNKTALGRGCNMVLKNFEPFSEAFTCAPGSRMNPPRKCVFF